MLSIVTVTSAFASNTQKHKKIEIYRDPGLESSEKKTNLAQTIKEEKTTFKNPFYVGSKIKKQKKTETREPFKIITKKDKKIETLEEIKTKYTMINKLNIFINRYDCLTKYNDEKKDNSAKIVKLKEDVAEYIYKNFENVKELKKESSKVYETYKVDIYNLLYELYQPEMTLEEFQTNVFSTLKSGDRTTIYFSEDPNDSNKKILYETPLSLVKLFKE